MKSWTPLGFDKYGRPIVLHRARLTNLTVCSDAKTYGKMQMLMLDQICSSGSPHTDQFILVFDMEGAGYANFQLDLVKTMIRTA